MNTMGIKCCPENYRKKTDKTEFFFKNFYMQVPWGFT